MKELLDKISSYNLFNYLLPGVLFVYISSKYLDFKLPTNNIAALLVIYYFIGLVISRFGSLILEPLCKGLKIIKFAQYENFLSAAKNDQKIELLSEINNMYRTLFSLFTVILLTKFYLLILKIYPPLNNWSEIFIIFVLLLIFLFSFKKQTQFIVKRIEFNKNRSNQ